MKKQYTLLLLVIFGFFTFVQAQTGVVDKIIQEETDNSQLPTIAHELMDGIGPRLVGSPKMKQAHDWAVKKYESWGIPARNEKWGEWRGWDRGITHIDMLSPWVKTLAGQQLAWSPPTPQGGVKAEVIILPEFADASAFEKWLPNAKGKLVMISARRGAAGLGVHVEPPLDGFLAV